MKTIIEKLKDYFENTPEEKIQEGWDRTKEHDNHGITVDEVEKHLTNRRNCENQYEYVDREKEIQELCKQVKEAAIDFWDNPNGPYEYKCPFCNHVERRGGDEPVLSNLSEIEHETNCAYLIAKDLSTNINN